MMLGRLPAAEIGWGKVEAEAAAPVSFRKVRRLIVTPEDYHMRKRYLSD